VLGYGLMSLSNAEGGAIIGQNGPANPPDVGQEDNEHRVTLRIANAGMRLSSWGLPEAWCLASGFPGFDDGCIR
jgi:hypothetical protein